ncbi:MAG: hypothetical protein AB7H43_07945 [Acidimicrobiia bacterium]
MDLSKLTLSDKIIGGTGLALLIDLLFFPWHHVEFDLAGLASFEESYSAVQEIKTLWAWLAILVILAILAALFITKFTSTKLPDLPVPLNQAIFFGTIAVLVLLLIKLASETDYLGFGAYLGILLAAGGVYGGFLKSKEPVESPGLA